MSESDQFHQLPNKQQQLLAAAVELFGKYGVRKVTVQEICNSADISKMTFYKYYTNKWDLAQAVMDFLGVSEREFFRYIVEGEGTFAEQLQDILSLALGRMHGVGLGTDFFKDVSSADSPIYDYYRAQQQRSRAFVEAFFTDGQANGDLDKNIEMRFLLFMFHRLSDLVNDPVFIDIKPDISERIAAISEVFVNGFSNP